MKFRNCALSGEWVLNWPNGSGENVKSQRTKEMANRLPTTSIAHFESGELKSLLNWT